MNLFKTLIILLLFSAPFFGSAQKMDTVKWVLLFKSDSFELSDAQKAVIKDFSDTIKLHPKYKIEVRGFTDSDGDSLYNVALSEKRVNSVKEVLVTEGIKVSTNASKWMGENQPIASNQKEKTKKLNRRVEIIAIYPHVEAPLAVVEKIAPPKEEMGDIRDLFKLIEPNDDEVLVNPRRDTAIVTKRGTIFKYKANSLELPKNFKDTFVVMKYKEIYSISDMVLNSVSTQTQDDKILESAGMVKTSFATRDGRVLKFKAKATFLSMVPTKNPKKDMRFFGANTNVNTGVHNWKDNTNVMAYGFSNYTFPITIPIPTKCKFFFCRIFRLDDAIRGTFNSTVKADNKKFRQEQRDLRKGKYKQSKGVNTKFSGNSFSLSNMTPAVLPPNLSAMDSTFYVMNTAGFQFANCDRFANYDPSQMVNVYVKDSLRQDTRHVAVLGDDKVILQPFVDAKGLYFRVPKHLKMNILSFKFDLAKNIFMGFVLGVVGKTQVEVKFEKSTREDLMKRLKEMD